MEELDKIKLGKAEERGKVKGISIGEKRGINIGANNKTVELAKRMLKKNMSISDVSEVTGLSKSILSTML